MPKLRLLVLLVLVLPLIDPSHAARKALVIGIDEYQEIPKLERAVGDARAMKASLEQLGFEVNQVLNANRRQLNLAIADFKARLTPDDIALVHFSGHGVEIDGQNYLLPADVPKPEDGRKDAVASEAISLQRLIARISASGVRTRLLVIDACRDNPFAQSGVRSVGATRGLARTEAPAGTFIMYSAGYRQKALDRLGASDPAPTSVYTRVLTKRLLQPGRSLAQIARDVRADVEKLAKSVGHTQRPAYYDELSAGLVLKAAGSAEENKAADPNNSALLQAEITYWNSVKDARDKALLKSYLDRYPKGTFAELARLKINALQADGKQKTEPKPVKVVKAEPVETPELRDEQLVRDLQSALKATGCLKGRVDGMWGPTSRRALADFGRAAKYPFRSLEPTAGTLERVRSRTGRPVCVVKVVQPPAEKPETAPQPQLPARRIFNNPTLRGLLVDICVTAKTNCKGAAANRWCKAKGFTKASQSSFVTRPQTAHIGGGTCTSAGFVLCGGYNRIVCVR